MVPFILLTVACTATATAIGLLVHVVAPDPLTEE